MVETRYERTANSDRGVSPVIGVILMVAITVILASVLGTFVLEMGQEAGGKAPELSASFQDDDQPYDPETDDEGRLFRVRILGLSDHVTVADLEFRIIEPDGTPHVFLGQDAVATTGGMELTINGKLGYAADDPVEVGDTLIVKKGSGTAAPLADDTDYTLQIVFIGGQDTVVVAEGDVRLQ